MKVCDLIEQLQALDPEATIVVNCRDASPRIGPSASAEVYRLRQGIDWNSGKIFIDTKPELTMNFERLSLKARAFTDIIGWAAAKQPRDQEAFPKIVRNIINSYLKKTGQKSL
jgi:hypothetical protein